MRNDKQNCIVDILCEVHDLEVYFQYINISLHTFNNNTSVIHVHKYGNQNISMEKQYHSRKEKGREKFREHEFFEVHLSVKERPLLMAL